MMMVDYGEAAFIDKHIQSEIELKEHMCWQCRMGLAFSTTKTIIHLVNSFQTFPSMKCCLSSSLDAE
jgi:hypothetical protein